MRAGRGGWGRLGVAGEDVSWETGRLGRREGRGGEVRWWVGLEGVTEVSMIGLRGLRGMWVRGAVKDLFVVGVGSRDIVLVISVLLFEDFVCSFQE